MKITRLTFAIVLLIVLIGVALGYIVASSLFLQSFQEEEWFEPVIFSILFVNNSSSPDTGGTYNLYTEGEHGLWDCRIAGRETGYFQIKIWNDGSTGHVYASILVDSKEYDHWEGDLRGGESTIWTTRDFASGSYSSPGFSNFTVRTYDTSTSPWTITDEQTVTVKCFSVG